jgi:hypothetical protein
VDLAALKPAEQLARALAIVERSPVARIPEHFVLVGRVLASVGGLLFAYPPRGGIFGTIALRLARAATV